MIAYFDTSAIIPLLIREPGSGRASRLWDDAGRVVSVRLAYAEARAALAMAARADRITRQGLRGAVAGLERLYRQIDLVEVTDTVVRRAGALAEAHALRGYDAVHLAAASSIGVDELVLVAADRELCAAAAAVGLAVGRI